MTTDPSKAIEAAANATKEIVKPLYEDAVQPLAKETGMALGAAGSFVRMAVRPFQTLALGMHLTFDWLDVALRRKFEGVPPEKIVEPPANVAGPLMLAAGFTSEKESDLRALYAQLLATAMHVDTQAKIHPAFVEILRQLKPAEALMLKPLNRRGSHPAIRVSTMKDGHPTTAGLVITAISDPALPAADFELESIGVQNLARLGVVEVDFERQYVDETRYAAIRASDAMKFFVDMLKRTDIPPAETLGILTVTGLGGRFLEACLGVGAPPDAKTPDLAARKSKDDAE